MERGADPCDENQFLLTLPDHHLFTQTCSHSVKLHKHPHRRASSHQLCCFCPTVELLSGGLKTGRTFSSAGNSSRTPCSSVRGDNEMLRSDVGSNRNLQFKHTVELTCVLEQTWRVLHVVCRHVKRDMYVTFPCLV